MTGMMPEIMQCPFLGVKKNLKTETLGFPWFCFPSTSPNIISEQKSLLYQPFFLMGGWALRGSRFWQMTKLTLVLCNTKQAFCLGAFKVRIRLVLDIDTALFQKSIKFVFKSTQNTGQMWWGSYNEVTNSLSCFTAQFPPLLLDRSRHPSNQKKNSGGRKHAHFCLKWPIKDGTIPTPKSVTLGDQPVQCARLSPQ